MRICIALDGVIAALRAECESYKDVSPVEGAVDAITALRKAGHTIIIASDRYARNTRAPAGIAFEIFDWLAKYNITYDEIYLGKPVADLFIEPVPAILFKSWDAVKDVMKMAGWVK